MANDRGHVGHAAAQDRAHRERAKKLCLRLQADAEKKGLSQRLMCFKAGIQRTTWRRYIDGTSDPKFSDILAVCDVLGAGLGVTFTK